MFIMKKLPSQVPSSTEIKEKHDLHNQIYVLLFKTNMLQYIIISDQGRIKLLLIGHDRLTEGK